MKWCGVAAEILTIVSEAWKYEITTHEESYSLSKRPKTLFTIILSICGARISPDINARCPNYG
jgi:hypothetical protein